MVSTTSRTVERSKSGFEERRPRSAKKFANSTACVLGMVRVLSRMWIAVFDRIAIVI